MAEELNTQVEGAAPELEAGAETAVKDVKQRAKSGRYIPAGIVYVLSTFNNTKVTITEKKTNGNMVWGRIDKGWISLDYVKLDSTASSGTDVQTVPASAVISLSSNSVGSRRPAAISSACTKTRASSSTVSWFT